MNYQKLTKGYMFAVLIAGLVSLTIALFRLPFERVNLYFLALFCFTIGVGSRMTIPIPRLKSHIAVSDTFIFLAILIFGGELAIVLAAVEAFFSSRRFCSENLTIFFNVAAMALSTSIVVLVLNLAGLYGEAKLHGQDGHVQDFVVALSLIALTQFVINTGLAAIHDALKNASHSGKRGPANISGRSSRTASVRFAAGLLVQLSDSIGFGIIIAAFPVVYLVFLSYRMYLSNVEISIKQAEQAEEYAKVLEQRSTELRDSEKRFRSAPSPMPRSALR